MAQDMYEVIADEVTIHRQVGVLTDPITGRELGIQQGAGKTYLKSEKIPASDISPLYLRALEDDSDPMHASVSQKLKKAGSGTEATLNVAARLGLPFAGYDDIDEDEILGLLRHLPSPTIQAVKAYEAQGKNRERIVTYNIGQGESLRDREQGLVGSTLNEDGSGDEDKATSQLVTREVTEDSITHGEGVTGTGEGQLDNEQAEATKGTAPARRRSRRARPAAGASDSSGSDE